MEIQSVNPVVIIIGLIMSLFSVSGPNNIAPDTNSEWAGKWVIVLEEGKFGQESELEITNITTGGFDFDINALWVYQVGTEGKEEPTANMGEISGHATFISDNEAYYVTSDYSDYKIIFSLKENKIIVDERNMKTGEEYGISPGAGLNVFYRGEYVKQK